MKKITADTPEARSADLMADNLDKLRGLLPQAFTEDGIDFQVLRELLGDAVAEGEERYGLNWHGKAMARRLALTPSTGTLRPAKEESVDWDTTQNLIIEGDNLDVLKLMHRSYSGRFDIIYIDPPYNTGNDFVYPDDFTDTISHYLRLTGVDGSGTTTHTNQDVSGRFHTRWLNMIYPRLLAGHALLKDTGVLFVSIDGAQRASCELLIKEIFGDENYLATFVWVSNLKGRQLSNGGPVGTHEYILCAARSAECVPQFRGSFKALRGLMPNVYKGGGYEIFHDAKGPYVTKNQLYNTNSKFNEITAPTMVFEIHHNFETGESRCTDVDSGETFTGFEAIPPHPNARKNVRFHAWRWSRKKVVSECDDLVFRKSDKGIQIFTRVRDVDGTALKDVILGPSTGTGQKDLKEVGLHRAFETPKPVALLKTLFHAAASSQAAVLDFFAGSGSTAQAIMELNAKDGGTRRSVLVQLPEPTEQNDFSTIADITKERVRRAAKKLRKDNPDLDPTLDLGFRVFKLDSTNVKPWDAQPTDIQQQLTDHVDHIKVGRTDQDLLYEVLLKLGLDLAVPMETRTIGDLEVHNIGAGQLMACFGTPITLDQTAPLARGIIKWQAESHPVSAKDAASTATVLFLDSAFKDDVVKQNLVATLEQAGLRNVRSL